MYVIRTLAYKASAVVAERSVANPILFCVIVRPHPISFPVSSKGSIPGMGRGGGLTAINRIDRRPKALLVAGFAAEEKDEVLLHLGSIAQIESHDFDVDAMGKTKLVVSFFDRKSAESVATQVRYLTMNKSKMAKYIHLFFFQYSNL